MPSVPVYRRAYGQVRKPLSHCIYGPDHLLTSLCVDILPQKLIENLPASLQSQAADLEDSVEDAISFNWGTPERIAINMSYDQTMRILLIIGIGAEVIALFFSLCMRDLNLKTLDETRDYGGLVIGKSGAVEAIKERVHGTHGLTIKTEAMRSNSATGPEENISPVDRKALEK